MCKRLPTLLFVGCVLAWLGGPTSAIAQTPHETQATVEAVLNDVQKALVEAQTTLADEKMPPLSSVKLTLHTEVAKSAGGKISFLVFSFGTKWEQERSQELVLTLKPPQAYTSVPSAAGPKLYQQLLDAIIGAARGVQEARTRKPALELAELTVELGFVLTKSGSAGGTFTITPITAELSGDLKKTAIHKIVVTFALPEK